MDGVLMYEVLTPEPPPADPTVCPADGGDHNPETEDVSFSGNFWGQPVLEVATTTNCTKCSARLDPPEPDEPDRYDESNNKETI